MWHDYREVTHDSLESALLNDREICLQPSTSAVTVAWRSGCRLFRQITLDSMFS